MIKNPLLMQVDGADAIVDGASIMANGGARDRVGYAVVMSVIAFAWAPPLVILAFVISCAAWEFCLRPAARKLIMSPLFKSRRIRAAAYYACMVIASTVYAGIQLYALFTGHKLALIIVSLTYCSAIMASVGYVSRSRGTFVATMAPMTLATFLAPIILHLDLAGIVASTMLNALVLIAALLSIRHNDELFTSIEDESQARAKAEDSNVAKSQFLATMSHELRTPLNAIIGYSEMMKEAAQDDGRALDVEDHDKVIRAAHSLLMLINDVLDISKIEAGKMQLKIEQFDVAELVAEAASTATPLAHRNGNRLDIFIEPGIGASCSDNFRLNQCLLNLLSNAAKFTKDGVLGLSARRMSRDGVEWLEFEVSDTGIGISDAQMERLFQPFVQADGDITRAYGGTGLGLAITQRIAKLLGGEVTAKSQIGAGSVFSLRVPVEFGHVSEPDGAFCEIDTEGRSLAIVIDDDKHMQELASRHLTGIGMSVLCAGRGAEGVQMARARKPSIIVLDINLPDQSGWRLLEDIRNDAILADTPVLIVSIEDDRQKAINLGACDLFTKPISKAAFVAAVMRYARPQETPPQEATTTLRAAG